MAEGLGDDSLNYDCVLGLVSHALYNHIFIYLSHNILRLLVSFFKEPIHGDLFKCRKYDNLVYLYDVMGRRSGCGSSSDESM